MEFFGRKATALLEGALSELHETRTALDLERSNRVAAEALAESYRLQAERANEQATRFEKEHSDLVKERMAEQRTLIDKLIAGAAPKDDPRALDHAKANLAQLPRTANVDPIRKALVDSDAALLKHQMEKNKASAEAKRDAVQIPRPN